MTIAHNIQIFWGKINHVPYATTAQLRHIRI